MASLQALNLRLFLGRYAISSLYSNTTSALPILVAPQDEFTTPATYFASASTGVSGTGTSASPWTIEQLRLQCLGGTGNTTLKDAALASASGVIVDIVSTGTFRSAFAFGWDNATGKRVTLRVRTDQGASLTLSGMDVVTGIVAHSTAASTGAIQMYRAPIPGHTNLANDSIAGKGAQPNRAKSRYMVVVTVGGVSVPYAEVYDSDTDATNVTTIEGKTTGGYFTWDRLNKVLYLKPMNGGSFLNLTNSTARSLSPNHAAAFSGSTATVEIVARESVVQPVDSNITDGNRRAGWDLVGFTFFGGAGKIQLSALNLGSYSHWRYCSLLYQSTGGVRVGPSTGTVTCYDIQLTGCRIAWSGQNGAVGTRVENAFDPATGRPKPVLNACLIEYANFKLYDRLWEAGATKFTVGRYSMENSIFRDCWAYGGWYDEKFYDCWFYACRAHDCDVSGFSTEVGDMSFMEDCLSYFNGFPVSGTNPQQASGVLCQNGNMQFIGRNVFVKNTGNIVLREDTGRYGSDPKNSARGSRVIGVECVADNSAHSAAIIAWFENGTTPLTSFRYTKDPAQMTGHNKYYLRTGKNFEKMWNTGDFASSATAPWEHSTSTSYLNSNNESDGVTKNYPGFERGTVFGLNTDAAALALNTEFNIPATRNAPGVNPHAR